MGDKMRLTRFKVCQEHLFVCYLHNITISKERLKKKEIETI